MAMGVSQRKKITYKVSAATPKENSRDRPPCARWAFFLAVLRRMRWLGEGCFSKDQYTVLSIQRRFPMGQITARTLPTT